MGLWSVVVPEATINLVINPSAEQATTGYAAIAGTLIRDNSLVTRPVANSPWSIKYTPAAGTSDGFYYGTVGLTAGTVYTFTVYVLGVLGVPYKAYFADTSANLKGTATAFTGTGDWQRVTVTWTADASASFRLYVTKNNHASTGAYWADALQVEAKAYATTYCDGYQPGCHWSGAADSTTSYRDATSRSGGKPTNLDVFYFYVTSHTGWGLPPVTNYYSEYAVLPGALHQHTKIRPRVGVLNGIFIGSTLANLHAVKKSLTDIIQPDDTLGPVILQYAGAGATQQIKAHYDGGLEGSVLEGFAEKSSIRFYCPAPDWEKVY